MGNITPTTTEIYPQDSAVTLSRYAKRIMYPECAFFGVKADDYIDFQCRDIWTQMQRQDIAFYLAEAQQEIEDVLGYPLSPTWIVGDVVNSHDGTYRYVDSQDIVNKYAVQTRWGHLISGGVKGIEVIDAAAVIDYTSEPAVITAATTVTDIDEIVVYHPSGEATITPSSIVIAAGVVTIEIPRCRLVLEDGQNNPKNGWDYSNLTYFETTVLINREFTDQSQEIDRHSFNCDCSKSSSNQCMKIINARTGLISVVGYGASCARSDGTVGLNYLAGTQTLSRMMEDAIIRLAHSKMPNEPCGCDVTQNMWERDRNIPDILTERRLECPFGVSDGAWMAWKFTMTQRLVRFGHTL